MKHILAAVVALATVATIVVPGEAEAEVSSDGAHLLALESVRIGVGMCQIRLTPDMQGRLDSSIAAFAGSQHDFDAKAYKQQINRITADMASSQAQVCSTLRDQGVERIYATALDVD
ncbi:hypothetical protein [Acidisphaera sp. L21]|uniref:hypothetical protein n=1 Tax=Acidisphaera sp. L21 TaxID=1641851 RepID=UPI00131AD346|nr:hypothetical protein [Acidisphaera sp. L21]